jgi:hypothetical protein
MVLEGKQMKADKQIESYIYMAYAYEKILTASDRGAFKDIEYRPALGELLYLLAVSEIELETFRQCRRKGEHIDSQITEYYTLVSSGRQIKNGEIALNACMNIALDLNFAPLNFTVSAEIANTDGVEYRDGYYFFDNTAFNLARQFGLHFCVYNNGKANLVEDKELDGYNENLIPQNAELMFYVNLLRDNTDFMADFSVLYKSGEKAITANLLDEYEAFVQQMKADYTICVYSRVRNVFSHARLLKLYDYQAIEGLQNKEIRLKSLPEDEAAGQQHALAKFAGEQTVKPGNILKISRNDEYTYYYYTPESTFKHIPNFETLPVNPDKIWEHLKKFKLFSTYAKELPPDISEGLSETEQQYARYIIANQLQSPTEKGIIKKRVSLDEMITHVLDPETIDEINRRKNGSEGENMPI